MKHKKNVKTLFLDLHLIYLIIQVDAFCLRNETHKTLFLERIHNDVLIFPLQNFTRPNILAEGLSDD